MRPTPALPGAAAARAHSSPASPPASPGDEPSQLVCPGRREEAPKQGQVGEARLREVGPRRRRPTAGVPGHSPVRTRGQVRGGGATCRRWGVGGGGGRDVAGEERGRRRGPAPGRGGDGDRSPARFLLGQIPGPSPPAGRQPAESPAPPRARHGYGAPEGAGAPRAGGRGAGAPGGGARRGAAPPVLAPTRGAETPEPGGRAAARGGAVPGLAHSPRSCPPAKRPPSRGLLLQAPAAHPRGLRAGSVQSGRRGNPFREGECCSGRGRGPREVGRAGGTRRRRCGGREQATSPAAPAAPGWAALGG